MNNQPEMPPASLCSSRIGAPGSSNRDTPPGCRRFTVSREVFSHDLTAEVTVLPVGVHVLFTGGCLPHIGAVTVVSPEGERTAVQFPTHKDQAISDYVSDTLFRQWGGPVTVAAGVHYDNATKEQILQIMKAVSDMTTEILQSLQNISQQ